MMDQDVKALLDEGFAATPPRDDPPSGGSSEKLGAPGARDAFSVVESRSMRPDLDADTFKFETVLVSMSPADIEWFNRNAPRDWREHIAMRRVTAERVVSGMELVMALDPLELIRVMRSKLALELATEIIKACEPITSRYTRGERFRL